MRVNLQLENVDEFRNLFVSPSADLVESQKECSNLRNKLYDQADDITGLKDKIRDLERQVELAKKTPIHPELQEEITAALTAVFTGKIQGIKFIRERTGMGLRESKELYELCEAKGNAMKARPYGSY